MGEEKKNILVTGGAGFVGGCTVIKLLKDGFKVSVVDNLDNFDIASVRIQEVAGDLAEHLVFYKIDLCNKLALDGLFASNSFDAVIHLADLKTVAGNEERSLLPHRALLHYDSNIIGTENLLLTMMRSRCKKLVYSSSALLSGWPEEFPCMEEFHISTNTSHGPAKFFIEDISSDIYTWEVSLETVYLDFATQYFIAEAAATRGPGVGVIPNVYSMKDDIEIRDCTYVGDLSGQHVAALCKIFDRNIDLWRSSRLIDWRSMGVAKHKRESLSVDSSFCKSFVPRTDIVLVSMIDKLKDLGLLHLDKPRDEKTIGKAYKYAKTLIPQLKDARLIRRFIRECLLLIKCKQALHEKEQAIEALSAKLQKWHTHSTISARYKRGLAQYKAELGTRVDDHGKHEHIPDDTNSEEILVAMTNNTEETVNDIERKRLRRGQDGFTSYSIKGSKKNITKVAFPEDMVNLKRLKLLRVSYARLEKQKAVLRRFNIPIKIVGHLHGY
ncbi:hypothetical protein GIB67_036419 [Kingdonia uniflora]|uniref:UDP-glucose 4-epimerase n=1 Tax=Kingdonia uniflora TaxID=39325 RepID=A0A7J7L489_9MAGN|nr:hypothetical protein GIB67_036419 [Kingdonia uniflora]